MKRIAFSALTLLVFLTPAAPAQTKRPMKVDDLFRFQRVSDPQSSPDGQQVAYVQTAVDLSGNKSTSAIWLAPIDGSAPRQLTASGKKDRHPRWSPDGQRLLFESNRSGANQLWVIDVGGGEARQLTGISTGASSALWARDGKQIAFVSAVWPEYSAKPYPESNGLNKKRLEEQEKGPVKAKVFTKLFYRHWDDYVGDRRQHLFVMPADGGEPRDVTPGDRDAYPTSMTFETGENYTFSPDGKYLVFTAVPERDEAWSTNYDLCRVPVSGGTKGWECLTKDNSAADSGPVFSPDGKTLAYRAQKKPFYEADRWELMTVATDGGGKWEGKPQSVMSQWDRSVDEFLWGLKGRLYFTAEDRARTTIFTLKPGTDKIEEFRKGQTLGSLSLSKDGRYLAYTAASLTAPAEVYRTYGLDIGDPDDMIAPPVSVLNLSNANTKLLAELNRAGPESVTVPGAGGTPMQMWILKPPGFDPKKKWPLVYLVHGGPQGAWADGWSYRWNPMLWAAQGYVVALPNPRGSTGFGQKYVDEISGDWGGKCYEDLMKGADYLEQLPYIDRERLASAGASFGGYMMNWFAVNTGRFKCLITHCSVWNFESMWGTTDELWFDEYEHGGLPWQVPGKYAEFSPHKKAGNLGKFKTPMLVIHNDLDFRCPIGQGHELFTTLQRQRVPSRMINFPDEGHWVLKPKNSEYWHKEVFAWLTKYVVPGGK